MAAGLHWGWRAFGPFSRAWHQQITALPTLMDAHWELTHHYLGSPTARVNVELREQDLRLKTLHGRRCRLECWLRRLRSTPFPWCRLPAAPWQPPWALAWPSHRLSLCH
jgi:hypothetical protein